MLNRQYEGVEYVKTVTFNRKHCPPKQTALWFDSKSNARQSAGCSIFLSYRHACITKFVLQQSGAPENEGEEEHGGHAEDGRPDDDLAGEFFVRVHFSRHDDRGHGHR